MWFDSVVLAGAVSGACVRPRAPNLVPTHLRCVLARVFSVQTHLGVLPPHRGHGNVHITDVPRATVQKAVLFIRQGECPCQWSGLFGRAIIPTTYLEIKKADSTEEVFITPLKIVTFKMCFYLFWFVFFLIKVKSDLGKWWRWTISATTCLFCFKEDDVFIPKKIRWFIPVAFPLTDFDFYGRKYLAVCTIGMQHLTLWLQCRSFSSKT